MTRNAKCLRILSFSAILLLVFWYVLPGVEFDRLTEDELAILQYGAYGSKINVPDWFYWTFLFSTLVLLSMTMYWGRRVRHLALAYFLLSILLFVPFGGMVIETGLSMTLRDLSNLLIGGILAVMYLDQQSSGGSGVH